MHLWIHVRIDPLHLIPQTYTMFFFEQTGFKPPNEDRYWKLDLGALPDALPGSDTTSAISAYAQSIRRNLVAKRSVAHTDSALDQTPLLWAKALVDATAELSGVIANSAK